MRDLRVASGSMNFASGWVFWKWRCAGMLGAGAGRMDAASPDISVRREKARSPSGGQTHPATLAPAGNNRSSRGGDEAAEAFGVEGHFGDLMSTQAATCSKRRAGLEKGNAEADPPGIWGRLPLLGGRAKVTPSDSAGVVAAACVRREIDATREASWGGRGCTANRKPARARPGPLRWRRGQYYR